VPLARLASPWRGRGTVIRLLREAEGEAAVNTSSGISVVKKTFTVFEWLPHYQSEWLRY
jgi:hypothetical protein